MFVNPPLAKEYLYDNVYASFQHDETAPAANWATRYTPATTSTRSRTLAD